MEGRTVLFNYPTNWKEKAGVCECVCVLFKKNKQTFLTSQPPRSGVDTAIEHNVTEFDDLSGVWDCVCVLGLVCTRSLQASGQGQHCSSMYSALI